VVFALAKTIARQSFRWLFFRILHPLDGFIGEKTVYDEPNGFIKSHRREHWYTPYSPMNTLRESRNSFFEKLFLILLVVTRYGYLMGLFQTWLSSNPWIDLISASQ
jgi:hypothetical protein